MSVHQELRLAMRLLARDRGFAILAAMALGLGIGLCRDTKGRAWQSPWLVGLYAVTAHSVRLRRKELGIRMALGAGRREIGALVLRRAMLQLAIGLATGLGATAAFDRLFTTAAMRLTDPVVMLPTRSAIVLVGIAACLWPASRAVQLDPVLVLRDE